LRQASDDGYVILNAGQVEQPQWVLKNVMVLFYGEDDQFLERFHVEQAELEPGRWHFENVTAYYAQNKSSYYKEFNLPTDLTIEDVEESFSSPETMSFWRLSSHIETLEDAGFDASRLRVYYHSLLAQPLLFAAMVLLAASVSMRPARFRGGMRLLSVGVFIGFVIFFLSSFLQALGSSGQIPVVLAAWAPAVISFLLGLSVMMGLEDG
jgi:lipopolysaccharide export system permease protein